MGKECLYKCILSYISALYQTIFIIVYGMVMGEGILKIDG